MQVENPSKSFINPPRIERWTIDRLDRETKIARIEVVPMLSEETPIGLMNIVSETGLEINVDDLSRWDLAHVHFIHISIKKLTEKLGIQQDEAEVLSENMVFWVIFRQNLVEPDSIFHATPAARKIAKNLYHDVLKTREHHEKK